MCDFIPINTPMNKQPRVKFYLEQRKDKKTGDAITEGVPILFSLSYGRRFKSSTGLSLDSNQWDPVKKRVKSSHTHAARMNKRLSDLKKELEDICWEAWDKDIRLTNEYISGKLKKNQQSKKGFFEIFEEYITLHKDKWQKGTLTKFTTMKNHFKEVGEQFRVKVEFDELNGNFFNKLLDFYFQETEEKSAFNNSYVRKNIKFIKQFLTWAAEQGYNKNHEYQKWKLETGNKSEDTSDNVVSLTIGEFLSIYKLKIENEAMQRTRDYLILACATGLRFSDIANLKKSDIDYKQGIIKCTTIKTGSKTLIPFNDFSQEILDKYRHVNLFNKNGVAVAFPAISNQKTNTALKDLGKEAGLTDMVTKIRYQRNKRIEEVKPKYELLSTHIGRKTFITFNVWMEVNAEVTMGLTSHKSHEMMEKYYSVNLSMKRAAMDKFKISSLESYEKSNLNRQN